MARKFLTPVELPAGSTAPTPSAGDNSTKLANTAYVDAAVAAGGGGGGALAPVTVTVATTLTKASHGNRLVIVSSASALNITIGTDATGGWGDGDYVDVLRYGAGTVTMVASGVTFRRASPFAAGLRIRYSTCRMTRIGANEWLQEGDLLFA